MANNEGLEKVLAEFKTTQHIGFDEIRGWEAIISHPLDRIQFYWELVTAQSSSNSGKAYDPGIAGYVRGQFGVNP